MLILAVESLLSDAHLQPSGVAMSWQQLLPVFCAASLNKVQVMAGLHGNLEKMTVEGEIEK